MQQAPSMQPLLWLRTCTSVHCLKAESWDKSERLKQGRPMSVDHQLYIVSGSEEYTAELSSCGEELYFWTLTQLFYVTVKTTLGRKAGGCVAASSNQSEHVILTWLRNNWEEGILKKRVCVVTVNIAMALIIMDIQGPILSTRLSLWSLSSLPRDKEFILCANSKFENFTLNF